MHTTVFLFLAALLVTTTTTAAMGAPDFRPEPIPPGPAPTEVLDCTRFDEPTTKALCSELDAHMLEVGRISSLKHFDDTLPALQTESYTLLKEVGKRFLDVCLEPRLVPCEDVPITKEAPTIPYGAAWKFGDNQWMMPSYFINDNIARRDVVRFPHGVGYCIVGDDEKSLGALFEETRAVHNQTYGTLVPASSGNAYRRTSGVLAEIDRALMFRSDLVRAAEIVELETCIAEYERLLSSPSTNGITTELRAKLFGKNAASAFLRDIQDLKLIVDVQVTWPLRDDERVTPLDGVMHRLLLASEDQRMRLLLATNPTLCRAVRSSVH